MELHQARQGIFLVPVSVHESARARVCCLCPWRWQSLAPGHRHAGGTGHGGGTGRRSERTLRKQNRDGLRSDGGNDGTAYSTAWRYSTAQGPGNGTARRDLIGHRRDTDGTPAGHRRDTARHRPPGRETFGPAAPQPQETFLSPAHAASPRPHARHARTRNRNRFPGRGALRSTSISPPHLRYIYLYMYTPCNAPHGGRNQCALLGKAS